MSLITLNSVDVARARVQVPAWGAPWLDLDLTEPLELARGAAATVVVADVTISGTIASGGAFEGRSAYRVVAGRGGWGKPLPSIAYANDLGVKASLVLSGAAQAAGEVLTDLPTTLLGPRFARIAAPASWTLNQLAPRNWYVGFDGVTHIGQRPQTTFSGDAPRTRVDKNTGVIELATEQIAGLVPGVVVDGMAPASDVEYELDGKRLTARIYSAPVGDRFLAALKRNIEALFPDWRYRGAFEFRVVSQTGERLNLQPVRAAYGFSDLRAVPVRPGMAGLKAQVLPGELVLVAFADADPSRPQVIAHDAPDAPGWMPLRIDFGGPGSKPVARLGDTVQAGPYAGVITSASPFVNSV